MPAGADAVQSAEMMGLLQARLQHVAALEMVSTQLAGQIETARDLNYTPYVVAGVLFICLTVPMARLTDRYARKQGFHGAGGML